MKLVIHLSIGLFLLSMAKASAAGCVDLSPTCGVHSNICAEANGKVICPATCNACPSPTASVINFEAFPNELKANLTELASMRCSVSTSNDLRHISSIFVTRNNGGQDLASVTPFDAPVALADMGNLGVKGSTTCSQLGECFIELAWKDASLMYLGDYTCTVTATDSKGRVVQLTSDLNMAAVTPSINDVIEEFKSKLMSQKHTIDQQQQELTNQTLELNIMKLQITHQQHLNTNQSGSTDTCPAVCTLQQAQLHNQSSEITNLKLQMSSLYQLNNNQSPSINHDSSASRVAFTATLDAGFHNSKKIFQNNQTVVFDKVLMNEGSAYSSGSGHFTCKKAGVYLFSVHGMSFAADDICLQLQQNGTLVTGAMAYDASYLATASMTTVIHLHTGDEVKVVSKCTSTFVQNDDYLQISMFTGVLINSD